MERLLVASKELSQKIETNDNAASDLLHQCEVLQQDIKSMVQVASIYNTVTPTEKYFHKPKLYMLEFVL